LSLRCIVSSSAVRVGVVASFLQLCQRRRHGVIDLALLDLFERQALQTLPAIVRQQE
jgi:hypothetical protein